MDVVKSWLLAGAVMIISDLALTFIVPVNYSDVHLLSPILAGFAAASLHLRRGRGGYLRHAVAVVAFPVIVTLYFAITVEGSRLADLRDLSIAAGATAIAAVLGGVLAHLIQRVLTRRPSEEIAHHEN